MKDTQTDWLSAFEAKEIEELRQWYEEHRPDAQAQRDAEEQQLVDASRTRREAYDNLRDIPESLDRVFDPTTSVWKTREEQRAAAIK